MGWAVLDLPESVLDDCGELVYFANTKVVEAVLRRRLGSHGCICDAHGLAMCTIGERHRCLLARTGLRRRGLPFHRLRAVPSSGRHRGVRLVSLRPA